jgi:hypothetical protein
VGTCFWIGALDDYSVFLFGRMFHLVLIVRLDAPSRSDEERHRAHSFFDSCHELVYLAQSTLPVDSHMLHEMVEIVVPPNILALADRVVRTLWAYTRRCKEEDERFGANSGTNWSNFGRKNVVGHCMGVGWCSFGRNGYFHGAGAFELVGIPLHDICHDIDTWQDSHSKGRVHQNQECSSGSSYQRKSSQLQVAFRIQLIVICFKRRCNELCT